MQTLVASVKLILAMCRKIDASNCIAIFLCYCYLESATIYLLDYDAVT